MASGSRPLHFVNDAAFPVLNSGSDELTQSLQDGPAFSKLLIGSLETHRQQFAVVVFIATAATASESGVGKQATPKGHWTLVTNIPKEFREYWVAADEHTETHVFQEGFLAVHPPSGILVAGSSNRMRAAMTRQLEPYTLHSRLPKDEQAPPDPPHFAAYLKTEGRMRYWLQLLQQARAPQGLPQAPQSPPTQVQPMEVDGAEDIVADQHTAHRGGGIPNMVPGYLLTQGIPLRDRPPSALTYAVLRLRIHYHDGQRLSNAIHQLAAGYADTQQQQLINGLLDPFDRFLTHRLELLNSEYPE